MVCETFCKGDSIIHRLDPRARLVAAIGLSAMMAPAWGLAALGVSLALGLSLAAAARLPVGPTARRMLLLNAFMLLLAAMLPLSMGGMELLRAGPLVWRLEGLARAGRIALKANAIVLTLTALLSTLDAVAMGRAMSRLRVPGKLIHLYFFSVRYIDVIHHEYERLRRAMTVRCFRPGVSRHTYRSLGYLVGMLLVKGFDRSERIVAAMKCRGFAGRFWAAEPARLRAADLAFATAAAAAMLLLGVLQWGQ